MPQRLTVPVEAVEVDVTPTSANPAQEVLEPANALRSRRDARTTAANSSFPERLYASDPLLSSFLGRDVGLIGQLRFLKCIAVID